MRFYSKNKKLHQHQCDADKKMVDHLTADSHEKHDPSKLIVHGASVISETERSMEGSPKPITVPLTEPTFKLSPELSPEPTAEFSPEPTAEFSPEPTAELSPEPTADALKGKTCLPWFRAAAERADFLCRAVRFLPMDTDLVLKSDRALRELVIKKLVPSFSVDDKSDDWLYGYVDGLLAAEKLIETPPPHFSTQSSTDSSKYQPQYQSTTAVDMPIRYSIRDIRQIKSWSK